MSFSIATGQYSISQNRLLESVTYLSISIPGTDSVKVGSGFFIQKETEYDTIVYLVTARHVLGNFASNHSLRPHGDSLDISFTGDVSKPGLTTIRIPLHSIAGTLLKWDNYHDVAAIRLASLRNNQFTFFPTTRIIKIGSSPTITRNRITDFFVSIDQVEISSDVFLIGFPRAIGLKEYPQYDYECPLLSKGIVSGIYTARSTIIIDTPVYGGNSGGPVFMVEPTTSRIKIIGVAIELIPVRDRKQNYQDNSGYSVVASIEHILTLLE